MTGRRWTDEEQHAYASFLSLARIADEFQAFGVIAAGGLVVAFAPPRVMEWLLPLEFIVLSLLVQFGLPKLLLHLAPSAIKGALPRGRFDGPNTPGAPHGYVDLLRMWRNPEWRCSHRDSRKSTPAPQRRLIVFVVSIFGVAALLALVHATVVLTGLAETLTSVLAAAITAVGLQSFISFAFAQYLRSSEFTSPRLSEVVVVLVIGVAVVTAVSAVALMRATGG